MEVADTGETPVDRERRRSNDTRAGAKSDAARVNPRVSRDLLP